MKLFKPQLQLARETEEQADGSYRYHYYLHTQTYADSTNYRVMDEDIDLSTLNAEGAIKIKLYMDLNEEIPALEYLTPVVHTLDLGTPVEIGTEFTIFVDVIKGLPSRDGEGGSSGSGQTSSSGADERDRPIGD